jgi:cell wall-associated NlpC family hydrolase
MPSPTFGPNNRQGFINYYLPFARKYQQQTGIPADTFLSIMASESNFGNTPDYAALFGIVGQNGTAGGRNLGTSAGPAWFRAYNSPDEAFQDFVNLVSKQPNYAQAWANRTNPDAFVRGLQAGGYAGAHNAEDLNWSNMIAGLRTNTIAPLLKQAASATAAPAVRQPTQPAAPVTQDPAKVDAYSAAIALGRQQIGKRYAGPVIGEADAARWGNPGWDCSSFVSGVYKQLGINLTPYTDAAYGETQAIDPKAARPGDIIFYKGGSSAQPNIAYHHMGIYLGGGKVLDAEYDGGVGVHDINAPDPNGKGWEIRRAPGIDTTQVPAAAQQAVRTATAVQQAGGGGGGTMTSPAATRATDPAFQQVMTGALSDQKAAHQQLDDLRARIAAEPDPTQQLILAQQLPGVQAAAHDADANVTKLVIAMNPNKAVTPEQTAQIAAQTGLTLAQTQAALAGIENAQATTALNQTGTALDIAKEGRAQQETGFNEALALQKAKLDSDQFQYEVTQGAFKNQVDLANALAGITKTNNDAWANYVKQQLDLGNVKLDAAVALTTIRSNQQAHEIAAAAQELSRADFISKQEAWNATHLFHAGQGYQQGFGPNDSMNVALARAGLGQDIITAAPVDPETFNPERMLARARGTMPANTYPSDEWLGIPGVQAQIGALDAIQPHAPEMLTPQGIGLPGVGQTPSYADLIAGAQNPPTSPFVAPALPDPAAYAPKVLPPAPPDASDPSFFGQVGAGVQQAAGNLAGAIGGAGLPNQGIPASIVPPRIRHGDTGAFDVATGASPQAAPPQVSIVPPTQQTSMLPTQPSAPQPYIPFVPRMGVAQARALPWRRGPDGRLIFLGEGEAA